MAKRSERLVELVQLLGGQRRITISEIAERFDVSPRTAYRDLADLGREVAPVVRDELGYGLISGAQLRPLNLTRDERRLLGALMSVSPVEGVQPLRHRLASLTAKLERAVDSRGLRSLGSGFRLHPEDRSGPISGAVFECLEESLDEAIAVRITYRSLPSGEVRERGVDPYLLFFRGAWYLVGRCHERNEPRTFRLDRIRSAHLAGERFHHPDDFDLDSYLAASWQIYRGNDSHEIEILFSPTVAPIVIDGSHHPGETVEERRDGSAIYRVTLSHLDEIDRWVLSFGGEAEVLGPAVLVARVLEMVEGVIARHQSCSASRSD